MTARTVLIIDDDVPFGEFLRATVESVGHHAVVVTSGSEAVEAFSKTQPSLVFLDLLLPKKDGFKVCEEIRALPAGRKVPIAMMTGIYKKAQYEREGLEKHGATAYLIKPFGVREIWSIVEQHLGRSLEAKPQPAEGRFALAGTTFAVVPLATLLAEHHVRESTGVLFVRGTGATYVIYLRDGAPVFVRSNDPTDRFDCVLMKTGQVNSEQVREAMAEIAGSRGRVRLGEHLVSKGVLTPETFETTLQLQLQLIVKRLFALPHGHAFFVDGEHPTEEDLLLKTDARTLLFKGARSTGCLEGVLRRLPPGQAVLSRCSAWEKTAKALSLTDIDARLLHLADGATMVERFLAAAAVIGQDGPRTLFALQLGGLVAAKVPDAGAIPAASEDPRSRTQPDATWGATAWRHSTFAAGFLDLVRCRATGTLRVSSSDGSATKTIFLQAGAVVAAHSDQEEDRLADMVLRLQLAPEEAVNETLDSLATDADDVALASALVHRGVLNVSEIYWATVFRVQAAVQGLLSLKSLHLDWTPGPLDPDVTTLPDIPSVELAWDAARCLPSEDQLALLGAENTWWSAVPDVDARTSGASLTAIERAVVDRLASPQTATLLTTDPSAFGEGASADDVRATLVALACTGAIAEIVAPDLTPAREIPALAARTSRDEKAAAPILGWDTAVTLVQPPPEPGLSQSSSLDDFVNGLSVPTPARSSQSADAATTPAPSSPLQFLDAITSPGMPAFRDPEATQPKMLASSESRTAETGRRRSPALRDPTAIVAELGLLQSDLAILRRAFDGDKKKVDVDRARMAALFDRLIALCIAASACGVISPASAEKERDLVGAGTEP